MSENFNPPYYLDGKLWIILGMRMSIIPKIRIIMLTKYEAPEGFENGYDEAIISPLGLFSFKPEKLFLNDQFFVDVGRKYYNLPKNLDSSIQFTTVKDVSFSSKELNVSSYLRDSLFFGSLLSKAINLVTKFIRITGTFDPSKKIDFKTPIHTNSKTAEKAKLSFFNYENEKYFTILSYYYPDTKFTITEPEE